LAAGAFVLSSGRLGATIGVQPESELPIPEEAPIPPLSGPPVVAVQAGHWEASALPDELAKLRASTGAVYGKVREVDINLAVASSLAKMAQAEGWKVLLLPSTVPPGLRADAFVAIHADWGESPSLRGWKVAPPWRASPASRRLAESIADSFASEKSLVEDAAGVTIGMRGYYAFSYRRFVHATSPFTPAVVLELGFVTNPEERRSLTADPDYWAGIVLRGLETYIASEDRSRDADFRPAVYPWVAARDDSVFLRQGASSLSRRLWRLDPGGAAMPVDESGDWLEVFLPARRATGWVLKSEVDKAPPPYRPFNFPTSGDR
jgi:N-acetylmuramoyl-L-alanine amidase